MGFMFAKCYKLKEIKGINKFNTNQVTNMSTMFGKCNELEYLDLSNFNTSKVNDMECMFNECYKIKYLGLSNFSINNECITTNIFKYIINKQCQIFANDIKLKYLFQQK
jgi:surface protein